MRPNSITDFFSVAKRASAVCILQRASWVLGVKFQTSKPVLAYVCARAFINGQCFCQSHMHDCVVLVYSFNSEFLHACNGWILKRFIRFRDVCEFFIMLKVLYQLKVFYRSFFDNKYRASCIQTCTECSQVNQGEEDMTREELKSSSEKIGQLYPILTDYYGNIIDGEHRFSADQNWKKMRLENIKTEEHRLIARIISNSLRRTVSGAEKVDLLGRLAEIYFSEGIENGKIAYKIAEKTGMSYQWVIKYLPDKFKDRMQSERARFSQPAIQRRATAKFLKPHGEVLTVKNYANTEFVNLIMKKSLYQKLEEKAKKLETTSINLIYSALLLILKT